MENNKLSDWAHLWTTKAKDYVLWCKADNLDWRKCSIFDLKARGLVIIEDDGLYCQVLEQMQRAGVPLVATLPPDPIDQVVEEMFSAGKSIDEVNKKRRELFEARKLQ